MPSQGSRVVDVGAAQILVQKGADDIVVNPIDQPSVQGTEQGHGDPIAVAGEEDGEIGQRVMRGLLDPQPIQVGAQPDGLVPLVGKVGDALPHLVVPAGKLLHPEIKV